MLKNCCLACLVLLLATPLCAQFQPRVDYPVGSTPFSVAVGDFNGDGHPDLAVTNSGASAGTGMSILLGNGDGTFKAHVDYGTGDRATSVVAGDFNHDGKLDLAVANSSSGSVSILLGSGDGTFQTPIDYVAGTNPQWLVAADFNNDGKLDIATANYGSDYYGGSVSIFLGNGDGTFQGQTQYAAGVNPFGIMAADFDRDGKLDLAVVDNNGSYGVWILLGNGDGSFQSPVYYASGYNPRVGVVADLNSDGNLDIAIANCISNNISILLGDGSGHFASQINYSTGTCPQTLAAGDFDGDGNLDLVSSDSGTNNVSLFKGAGNGTFRANGTLGTGNGPMWVAVADLNDDTAPDLVVTNTGDNTVGVLLNTGTDFSISASALAPASVNRGQASTSTVSLSLLSTFPGPVTLGCSVQPTQSAPTCSFSPNPATFDSQGNAAATLTIDTSTTTASLSKSQLFQFVWLPVAGFALIGVGFKSGTRCRNRLAAFLAASALCGGLLFQSACSGASSGPKSSPQTYTITITGTAGSHQHSATTALTVQ